MTPGYAIIMIRQPTIMGPIDTYYCVNDEKQIGKIDRIDRENKRIKVLSDKGTLDITLNNEPSQETFLHAVNELKESNIDSASDIWFFQSVHKFLNEEGMRYKLVNGFLMHKPTDVLLDDSESESNPLEEPRESLVSQGPGESLVSHGSEEPRKSQ
jgi:hypothetical protein